MAAGRAPTGKRLKIDPKSLGAIVAHPTRSACLTLLADRVASPAEISRELLEPLADVSYHIRLLLKAGIIELVCERPARGSLEHFYRAIVRPMLSDEEVRALPLKDRQTHAKEMMSVTMANGSTSLEAGVMCKRDDYHMSRVPLQADAQAWTELSELYRSTLDRIFEIQCGVAKRGGETFAVIAFGGFFEMPPTRGHHNG